MKNIILLVAVVVVGACASMPTVKSGAGTYEYKEDGYTYRMVFLDNGISEVYINGKKREEEGKWKLTKEGELHATYPWKESILVHRINKDGSITLIARIEDGKREEAPKEAQITLKKIK